MFFKQVPILEDIEEQLNLIPPVCLPPYKKEINSLFSAEKQKFLFKKRFGAIFSKTRLKSVCKNRNSLKNISVKQKQSKQTDTDMSENRTNTS